MKRYLLSLAVLGCLSGPAAAEPLVGIWQTMPDAKAQTGHVQIYPCGAQLCGKVISAYDRTGRQITTPSVGKRIFWDISAAGGGRYAGGRVYVPIMHSDFPVEMSVSGNRLDLRACNGIGICRTQSWTRVK